MLNLMKYELKRRKALLTTVMIVLVCLEAAICLGLYLGGNWNALSIVLSCVVLVGGLLFPFIDTIANYYSDFKNKHGYMLFLTPNKGIKIIGSKALFALIELIVMVGLVIGSIAITMLVFKNIHPGIYSKFFADIFTDLQRLFELKEFTFWSTTPLILVTILQYFNNIMLAVLAITLSKTILSNNNFNWLFALLFYLGLSFGLQAINSGVLVAFGFVNDMIEYAESGRDIFNEIVKYIYIGGGIYTFWIAVSTTVSSILLDKRTDL